MLSSLRCYTTCTSLWKFVPNSRLIKMSSKHVDRRTNSLLNSASTVDFVRPTTIASLSHWASSFVELNWLHVVTIGSSFIHMNWIELQFAPNSTVNSLAETRAFRTKWPRSEQCLQPINTKQVVTRWTVHVTNWRLVLTGSTSVQFSSYAVNVP